MRMYDMSSKFNTFYATKVVLPQTVQTELYNKKDLNLKRLKDGLAEYNAENGTSYTVVEDCVQGSVEMSTVVQNEGSDYDIDVAVVFSKLALGDKGALATRNMVANALRRKTKQFNAEPEVKTSCVRIKYAEGYHIDFAVYRRYYDVNRKRMVYEHAGSTWTEREITGLSDWFDKRNRFTKGKLRKVIRLSKMFCRSRDSWKNMPSGLLQTVLCDEKLQSQYDRLDELFYYTMKAIVNRLEFDTSVSAPVDNGRDLIPRETDKQKMANWKNRLKSKLEDLDILFDSNCTKEEALQAWYGFFNHDFWKEQAEQESTFTLSSVGKGVRSFEDTEQFIEDLYPVNKIYNCSIACTVEGDGFTRRKIDYFLSRYCNYLPHNFKVYCTMNSTNCPSPYSVFWKVKNVGPVAERRNQVRGEIKERGSSIFETTNFYGHHYIECYIVKDGVCVASDRVEIPIGRG